MNALSSQRGSLLHRQPFLLCERQQLCLIWYVFAWHIILHTLLAFSMAVKVSWEALS